MLRDKTEKKAAYAAGTTSTREGKQYTVGNVGSGGWLYLK